MVWLILWRFELHLALVESDPRRICTAVQYSHIRDVLLESQAARRIVILDCCYSGRALGQMAADASAVVNEASAEGTYVLAASAENKAALAPPGLCYTAFTGELLSVIRNGIPGHGPLLDLESIYRRLIVVMKEKGFPRPQKRDRNTAGALTLIRNQAFRPPTTVLNKGHPIKEAKPSSEIVATSNAITTAGPSLIPIKRPDRSDRSDCLRLCCIGTGSTRPRGCWPNCCITNCFRSGSMGPYPASAPDV